MTTNPRESAFPAQAYSGLTKREYFAGQALVGLLASVTLSPLPISAKIQMAVECSDAIINELNK